MVYDNIGELGERMFAALEQINFLEKAISVCVTIVIFLICLKVCNVIIGRLFNENKKNLTIEESKRVITLKKASKTFIRTFLLIAEILVLLSFFVDIGALLAVAGVGTLAIGFGAQGLVEDVMSGFVIIFENQFSVGDYVTIDNHYGIVETIGVRTTAVRELDGGLYIIHNGKIDRLINHSKGTIKAMVEVHVAYEENIDYVLSVLEKICEEVYNANTDLFIGRPEVLGVTKMDASSMNIKIIADEDAARKVNAETALRKRIKEVFDEKGIEIPYEKYVLKDERRIKKIIEG
ncbi:MAG: mechanosensitive ion channel family protein [Eubacterium sp.]